MELFDFSLLLICVPFGAWHITLILGLLAIFSCGETAALYIWKLDRGEHWEHNEG